MSENLDVEIVDVIASGYEWVCPKCDELNELIAIPRNPLVPCKCGYFSELNIAEHARD